VQVWKISRFAEVNKEWWVLLSLFVIAALLSSFGSVSPMLLFLYVLPTLFAAYFLGQRTAVSTALASIVLVALGLVLQHYVLLKDQAQPITDSTWYQLAVWSGILVLFAYATGTLFREMHESYSGYLLLLRYLLIRDDESTERLRRVSSWSALTANEMGMNRDEVEVIRTAAFLRDLSQLAISPEVMKKATKLQPWLASAPFLPPETGITTVQIDEDTGLVASSDCQHVISENYFTGAEPKQTCSLTAHNWILNLRSAPFEMSSGPSESPRPAVDSGKSEPLNPPKQPNAIKRFFSKIF